MTPSARIAATIELLESVLTAWMQEARTPADKICDRYFKERRYIGSHDRGAVAELMYWILRHKAALEWWCERKHLVPNARRMVMTALTLRRDMPVEHFATLFDGMRFAPPPLTESEWQAVHLLSRQELLHPDMPHHVRYNYPAWLHGELAVSLKNMLDAELLALNSQAPLDLRANTLLISREELQTRLAEEGYEAELTHVSSTGLRLKKREAIFASPLFRQGYFEVQDDGSQAVAEIVQAAPGMRVIDFCAGAGGKTLALAGAMQNKGRILAWDTSAKRLAQLPLRLRRAQVDNTEWRVITSEHDAFIKRHKQSADRVLIDVPCSGSGTWRRNPDLKWRFTPKDLEEVQAVQARIFESAARLVKKGGRIVYATCSLLKSENEQQVEKFLEQHPTFRVVCAKKIWNKEMANTDNAANSSGVSYLSLSPHQDGCDGFFAAVLERTAA